MFARLAVTAVLFAGCSSTSIDSHDYKRGCVNDSDCVVVYSGDLCAYCQCPNSGIAASELTKFQQDSASGKSGCPKTTPPVDCTPCVAQVPFCLDGACSAHAQ